VWALAFTVTMTYGVIYAFGVILEPMERELHLSRAQASLPLTVAYLTAGLGAPLIGRILDQRGAREVLTLGSALFAALVYLHAHAHTLAHLLLISFGLGIAMACTLYDVVFTVVAVRLGEHRARAILLVTLVGALASTIFVPLATFLESRYGWRGTLEILAITLAVLTVPVHAVLVRHVPSHTPRGTTKGRHASADVPRTSRPPARLTLLGSPSFWAIGGAFVLAKLAGGALGLHLVPLLAEQHLSAVVIAGAAGAVGVTQLVGRVVFTPFAERVPLPTLTAVVFLVHAIGIAALAFSHSALGLWAFVLLYGASNGAITMSRALLVADVFGTERYGTVNGLIALPVTIGFAVAPWLAGLAREVTGSYQLTLLGLILALLGAAVLVRMGGTSPPSRRA